MRVLVTLAGLVASLRQDSHTPKLRGDQRFLKHVSHILTEARLEVAQQKNAPAASCGAPVLFPLPHAQPKEWTHREKTHFNKTAGKETPVDIAGGEIVEFRCDQGYTSDGSRDGSDIVKVECNPVGFFTANGTCVKASKCGALPNITNAHPTGDSDGLKVYFECIPGFSLDGEERVPGGLDKNGKFHVECQEFSGNYTQFDGECRRAAIPNSLETLQAYNDVVEALFKVDCDNGLARAKKNHDEFPEALNGLCAKIKKPECGGLIADLQTEFAKDKEDFDAKSFCDEFWKILKAEEHKPDP